MDVTTLTMSVAEAAARLGVTPDWLRRRAASGVVPSHKLGMYRRFTQQDLDDYLASVRQVPVSTAAGTPLSRARRRRAS